MTTGPLPLAEQPYRRFPHTKVLVTGASGVLGSGVAKALVASGAQVTTLQRRPSQVLGLAREVQGSVTDPEAVAEAVAGQDAIVHIAAKVSVSGPLQDYVDVNVDGTRTLLEAAAAAGVTRWLHVSSPSVAHAGTSIVGEGAGPADPAAARGNYAATKALGELLALEADADETNPLHVLVLRPHLMWGPGDTQLTERIIDRSRQGRMPILGTGAPLIDTLYIDNAVDAVLAGLAALEHTHGLSLVVTNGEPRPVGELIRRIATAGGAPEPELRVPAGLATGAGAIIERVWELQDNPEDEPPLTKFLAEQLSTAHWFDQRQTRKVLNWTPRVSIAEGLRRTAEHYQPGAAR